MSDKVALRLIADLFNDEETLEIALKLAEIPVIEESDGLYVTKLEATKLHPFVNSEKVFVEAINARQKVKSHIDLVIDADSTADRANDEVIRLNDEIKYLEERVYDLEVELDEALSEAGYYEEAASDWESERDDAIEDVQRLESEVEDLREQVEQLEGNSEELQEEISELEEELEELRQFCDSYK